MNDRTVCTVEVSPDEVDAGAEITLTVCVEDPVQDDLKQPSASIRNHDNAELARAELKKSEDDGYEADIVLSAPRSVGEYVYRAVVVAADKDGASQDHASSEVRFVVKPHEAQLNVWDVPSTLVPGEHFKFTVGVRCSAGCDLAGQDLSIVDRDGTQIACAILGPAVWPGTDALYFAEVEAEAPPVAGNCQWEVKTAPSASELPHDAGSLAFGVKVVHPPSCEVTVEAVDREKQTPIRGARVVMHPYRAITAENGVAKLKVTEGRYDILVSASKYAPVSTVVEVTADVKTRAELDVESPLESPDED
jgi:hypothetical protein